MRVPIIILAMVLCAVAAPAAQQPAAGPKGLWEQIDAADKTPDLKPNERIHDVKAVSDTVIGAIFWFPKSRNIEYHTYDLKGRQISSFSVDVLTDLDSPDCAISPTFAAESNGNIHLVWTQTEPRTGTRLYSGLVNRSGEWIVPPMRVLKQDCGDDPRVLINEATDRLLIITYPRRGILEASIIMPSVMICLDLNHDLAFVRGLNSEVVEQASQMVLDRANRLHFLYSEDYYPGYWTPEPGMRIVYRVCDDPTDLSTNYTDTEIARSDLRDIGNMDLWVGPDGASWISYEDHRHFYGKPVTRHVVIKPPGAVAIKPQPVLELGDRLLIDSSGRRRKIGPRQVAEPAADTPNSVTLVEMPATERPTLRREQPLTWTEIAFSPDGRKLVTSGTPACVWDFVSGKLVKKLGAQDWILGFTSDGAGLILHGWDNNEDYKEIVFYDTRTFSVHRRVRIRDNGSGALSLSSANGVLVIQTDTEVSAWNLEKLRPIYRLSNDSVYPYECEFSPDKKQLAFQSGGMIKVLDLATGTLIRQFPVRFDYSQFDSPLDRSETDLQIAAASPDYLWALPLTMRLSNACRSSEPTIMMDPSQAVSTDGKLFAIVRDEKTVKVWEIGTGWLKYTLTSESKFAGCITFSPSGRLLVAGCEGGNIAVWSMKTGMFFGEKALNPGAENTN